MNNTIDTKTDKPNIVTDDNNTVLTTNTEYSKNSRIKPESIIESSTFAGIDKRYFNFAVDFYNKCSIDEIKLMYSIINNKTPVSLSFLEWFAMKYSKLYPVIYTINNSYTKEDYFDVNNSYRTYVDTYGKEYFDPCRRNKKFMFSIPRMGDQTILTTIGQLIFFRWCFYHNIISYSLTNYKEILAKKQNVKNYFNHSIKDTKLTNSPSNSTIITIDENKDNSENKICVENNKCSKVMLEI